MLALRPLHYFLLELQELGHFVFGGHQMCGKPSISVLLVTMATGTWWLAGPIFLRVSPARAVCSLGQLHSRFVHFVATTALALTAPPAFRALPALHFAFAAFISSATLAMCPTACPALAVYPDCPWSLNVPGHGFPTLHVGRDPGWGHLLGLPVEGSWLICIAPHPAETTANWPLSDQSTVGVGGPSP